MSRAGRTHSSISLPVPLLEEIDKILKLGLMGFRSRAEFVAEATRAYLRDLRRMSLEDERKEMTRKKLIPQGPSQAHFAVTLGCATNLGMAKQGMAPQDASSNPLVLQVEDPIFDGGTHDDYVRRVEQAGFLPVSPLSSDVRERFEAIAREDQ